MDQAIRFGFIKEGDLCVDRYIQLKKCEEVVMWRKLPLK